MRVLLFLFCWLSFSTHANIHRTLHRAHTSINSLHRSSEILNMKFSDLAEHQDVTVLVTSLQSGLYAVEEAYYILGDAMTPSLQVLLHKILHLYQNFSVQKLVAMDKVDAQNMHDHLTAITQKLLTTVDRNQSGPLPAAQLARILEAQKSMSTLLASKGYSQASLWKKYNRSFTTGAAGGASKVCFVLAVVLSVAVTLYCAAGLHLPPVKITPITDLDGYVYRVNDTTALIVPHVTKRPAIHGRKGPIPEDMRRLPRWHDVARTLEKLFTKTSLSPDEIDYINYNIAAVQYAYEPLMGYGKTDVTLVFISPEMRDIITKMEEQCRAYIEQVCATHPTITVSSPLASLSLYQLTHIVEKISNRATPGVLAGQLKTVRNDLYDHPLLWGAPLYTQLLTLLVEDKQKNTQKTAHDALLFIDKNRDMADISSLCGATQETIQALRKTVSSIAEYQDYLWQLYRANQHLTQAVQQARELKTRPPALSETSVDASISVL